MLHVDHFKSTISESGKSKITEESGSKTFQVNEALVVLTSVEKQDESDPERVSAKAAEQISKLAHQLKVNTIVIHAFAHLFGELSKPEIAVETMKLTAEKLSQDGFQVVRTPFGWFYSLEIKAKGHPLSRVARIVSID